MPRLLKDLRIDDVSSVDSGAGRGVRVMLMKRENVSKPWAANSDLPANVKGLPDAAQTVFREVANDRMKAGHAEVSAIRQAWTAVKNGWEKQGDQWVRKREFSAEERQQAAESGAAMPSGGYPIKTKQDLKNAIQAIGRAKNRSATIAHIKERARALGATDMLPEQWSKRHTDADEFKTANEALQTCVKRVLADAQINDKDAAIEKLFQDYESYLTGDPADDTETAMTLDELSKAYDEALAKASDGMSPEHRAFYEKLGDRMKRSFAGMTPQEREKYMKENPLKMGKPEPDKLPAEKKKAAKTAKIEGDHDDGKQHGPDAEEATEDETQTEAKKMVEKNFEDVLKAERAEKEELKKRLVALEEKDQLIQFGKRAADLGMGEGQGELLLKMHRGDPEALKKIEEHIKSLHAQVKQSDVFKEFGTRQERSGGASAYDQLVAKAAEVRKMEGNKITAEQAFAKAMQDPANRELVEMEKRERDMRVNRIVSA